MSGYNDPFSGFFGEPGAWNWPLFLFLGWAGFIVFCMALIFIGFDSGGFLHRLEERFKIKNVDRDPKDDQMI